MRPYPSVGLYMQGQLNMPVVTIITIKVDHLWEQEEMGMVKEVCGSLMPQEL